MMSMPHARHSSRPFKRKLSAPDPYGSTHQKIRKRATAAADGAPCPLCGVIMFAALPKGSPAKPVLDHVVPVVAGGASSEDNYAVICTLCNGRKGGRLDLPGRPLPYWETHDHYADALVNPAEGGDW
jgi:5-methylcytosine-specific restriction endonuclease McrA